MQQQARPDEVVPDARVAEQRRAVGGVPVLRPRTQSVQRLARLLEFRTLLFEQRVLGLVGGREVRVDRFELEVRAAEQIGKRPLQVLVPNPRRCMPVSIFR